jgi:transcriptional regulator with XRE-family HTH domain
MERQVLFGRRIRSIREAKNLSRETVAERAGTDANYLGELERGEKWPRIEMMEGVAAALEVSPAAFFEYEAEEIDSNILLGKLQNLLSSRNTEQLQQALRVLRALFQIGVQ